MRLTVSVNDQSKEFDLRVRPIIIGRAETCDFQPQGPGTEFVSGKHAIVKLREGYLTIEDLGSSNGTYVNDSLCSEIVRLQPTDRIQLGRFGPQLVISGMPVPAVADPAAQGDQAIGQLGRRSFLGEPTPNPVVTKDRAKEPTRPAKDSAEAPRPTPAPQKSSSESSSPPSAKRKDSPAAPEPEKPTPNIFATQRPEREFIQDTKAREPGKRESHAPPAKVEPSTTRALLIKTQKQNRVAWLMTLSLLVLAIAGVSALVFIQTQKPDDEVSQETTTREVQPPKLVNRLVAIQNQCAPATALVKATLPDAQSLLGSGFLVDRERGLIITSSRFVISAEKVQIYFPKVRQDGSIESSLSQYIDRSDSLIANVIASDPEKDLALLQVDQSGVASLAELPLAEAAPKSGSEIFALGNTDSNDGRGWIVSEGVVRAVVEDFMCQVDSDHQLNADILVASNSMGAGSQGGPVVNDEGAVVAIVSHSSPDSRLQSQFISISEVRDFFEKHVD